MGRFTHYLIPTHTNNHRPYALRHKSLAIVSALLLLVKVTALGFVALTPSTADLSTITTERIIQLTNVERKKAGLGEVKMSSKLSTAALQKGQDMLEHDYFAHISPTGVTPWFWMSKVGYTYTVAGENLAIDFTSAEDVVAAWMASPSHRENLLLPDYQDIGVGVVTGEFEGGTSTIVIQMFGRPLGTTAAVKATTTSSPTPSASPKPSAKPTITPSLPTVPPSIPPNSPPTPRIPRIALASPLVSSSVDIYVEGDAGSQVHILLNSQERKVITLGPDGTERFNLSLDNVPDGALVIRAYASNTQKRQSELSEPIQLAKDTVSPSTDNVDIAFAVSPLFDSLTGAAYITGTDADSIVINDGSTETELPPNTWKPLVLSSQTLSLQFRDSTHNTTTVSIVTRAPQFAFTENQSFPEQAAHYWTMSRRLAGVFFAIIFVLLLLAVFIRIRIQHLDIITHASVVLVLAAILFLF